MYGIIPLYLEKKKVIATTLLFIILRKKYGDIETIVSTTEHYKKRGKLSREISAQDPIVSHRNFLPKVNS